MTVFAVAIPAAIAQERGFEAVLVQPDERDPQAPPERVQLYSHSFALVIGIDAYRNRAWPRLSNAVRDAKAVATTLERHGFKTTLKTDLASAEIEAALRDFFINVGAEKGARLLFWFAGHGHTLNDEGYLVPADAPAPSVEAAFRYSALSLRRFSEYMREAQSRHVLAIFDSCFGGAVFDTARALPPAAITRATTLPVRQMISSGEAEQQVSDDGTFRKLFIAALDGEEPQADANRDGFITGTELGLFLADKLTNLMRSQTPRYGKLRALGYDRGDFVFRVGGPAKSQVVANSSPAAPPVQTAPAPMTEAERAWGLAKDTASIPALEAFIRRFGDTYYGDLAKDRLADLKRAQAAREAAEVAKKKADEETRAKAEAERQRLAMLQQQEERKRAEDEAPRKRAEELKKATDAMAQRRDGGEWLLLGEQTVGFKIDRDVVNISVARERAFARLHLVAERNDIHLIGIRLVYTNGHAEDFRIDRLIRAGQDQPVDLRGERMNLQRIEMTYRSRPSFEGSAVMKVYGEPARLAGPVPSPLPPAVSGGGGAWVELGCQRISLFGTDRDTVRVGRREGRFKAIRLHVRGADVEMLDLRVIYTNGEPDNISVRSLIRQGDRTRPLDLRGRERSIDRVEMTYRTAPNFKGQATVCAEGLQS